MLPEITSTIREKHGWEYYYYGNLPFRGDEPGWYTFDHRPRFNNNYVGLRNRIAILSEAYAYATFEERVLASLYFVEEILEYAAENAPDLRSAVRIAEARQVTGSQLAVRSDFARSAEPVEILMGSTSEAPNPYTGEMVRVRDDVIRPQTMYEYGTFEPTETERVPSVYYVDPRAGEVRDYLDLHGIAYSSIDMQSIDVEAFTVDSTTAVERPFQGVRERTVYGRYARRTWNAPEGTLAVPMDQPLARLAFYLLEPRSDDGLVNWAVLDAYVEAGSEYPVYRSVN
jgi:hypothetical protein